MQTAVKTDKRKNYRKRLFLERCSYGMKHRPTGAEAELAKKLDELKTSYEEQKVIRYKGLDFIYDFHLIKPRKVFIEVDGGYHNTDEQRQTDRIKDFICKKCIFQDIVRFTNKEAINFSASEIAKRLKIA